jgi:hypothetical protein
MKNCVLISLLILNISFLAQTPNLVWAKTFGDTTHSCCPSFPFIPSELATDSAGNVYCSGIFEKPVDFDPGPGVQILSPSGYGRSSFFAKYSASGALLWAKKIDGEYVHCSGTCVDHSGAMYCYGRYYMTVDFDPGPGTFTMSSSNYPSYLLKLDAQGNFVWCYGIESSSPSSIVIDQNDNLYYAGLLGETYYSDTLDLDPGPSAFTVSTAGTVDAFVAKLNSAGNFAWGKTFSSDGGENINSIALDVSGNVYCQVGGRATLDLDPGPGTYTLLSSGILDARFLVKLDANGNFIWAKDLGDVQGQLMVDNSNNIFLNGDFAGTIDLDPGPGTNSVTSIAYTDAYICKFDGAGNYIWGRTLINSAGYMYPQDMAIDSQGNIYTSGFFGGCLDFDPGPGIDTVTSLGAYFQKLNSAGQHVWGFSIRGIAALVGSAIAVNGQDIYVSSLYFGSPDLDPGPGTHTVPPGGGTILKLCEAPAKPQAIMGNTLVCAGSTAVFSVAPVPGATNYVWNFPNNGIISTPSTNVSVTSVNSGTVNVSAANGCGVSYPALLAVDACTDLKKQTLSANLFSVRPNPSTGIFEIQVSEELLKNGGEMKLLNALGQEIYKEQLFTGRTAIHLDLPAGVYFCRLSGCRDVTRVVIEKH